MNAPDSWLIRYAQIRPTLALFQPELGDIFVAAWDQWAQFFAELSVAFGNENSQIGALGSPIRPLPPLSMVTVDSSSLVVTVRAYPTLTAVERELGRVPKFRAPRRGHDFDRLRDRALQK